MRLEIEWRAIILAVTGSIPGIIFGFHYVSFGEIKIWKLAKMPDFAVRPFIS
jgi:hypothetical protein